MIGSTYIDAVIKNSVAEVFIFDDLTMQPNIFTQRELLIGISRREFEYLSNDPAIALVVVQQPQCFFILSNLLRRNFDYIKLRKAQVVLNYETWYVVNEAVMQLDVYERKLL